MSELDDLKARVARLEAIVKEHLPCPHTKRWKSTAYGKQWYCEDCGEDFNVGETAPFPSLRIR